MNHRRRIAAGFGALHPHIFGESCLYSKVLVGHTVFRRFSGNIEGLGHREDAVRFADRPVGGKHPWQRQILVLALGTILSNPGKQCLAIPLGEASVVGELAVAWVSEPRRHAVLRDYLADRLSPGAGVVIGQQRHRADLTWSVTVLTILLQDACDLFGVSDGSVGLRPGDAS